MKLLNGALLEAKGLGIRAAVDRWLLRDVDVELQCGQRLALVGPSGSGKTLLLRALAMLDPVDTGQVLWSRHEVAPAEVPAYRSQVIYLHQRPALWEGTVESNLRGPFALRINRARRFDPAWIVAQLESLGRSAAFLTQSTRNLSGGEGQIVALLRALQMRPRVLLLDEPTASLDRLAAEQVEQLIARWFDEERGQRALVWVSHNSSHAQRLADRTVEIRAGEIARGP